MNRQRKRISWERFTLSVSIALTVGATECEQWRVSGDDELVVSVGCQVGGCLGFYDVSALQTAGGFYRVSAVEAHPTYGAQGAWRLTMYSPGHSYALDRDNFLSADVSIRLRGFHPTPYLLVSGGHLGAVHVRDSAVHLDYDGWTTYTFHVRRGDVFRTPDHANVGSADISQVLAQTNNLPEFLQRSTSQ